METAQNQSTTEYETVPSPEVTISEMVGNPIQFDLPKQEEEPKSKYNSTRKGMKYKPRKPKEVTEQVIDIPKDLEQPKSETINEPTTKKDDSDDLKKTIEEIKPAGSTDVKLTQQQKVYITGRMFLFMLNIVAPFTFSSIWNMFNKNQKVKSEDLKLTKEELDEVEELADEVTKEIIGSLSPMSQLLMYLGICYGAKLMFAPKYAPSDIKSNE